MNNIYIYIHTYNKQRSGYGMHDLYKEFYNIIHYHYFRSTDYRVSNIMVHILRRL